MRVRLLMGRSAPAQLRGNDAFKRGVQLRKKFYLREAVDLYTQGLASNSSDAALDAVLYANRAEVCDSRWTRMPWFSSSSSCKRLPALYLGLR